MQEYKKASIHPQPQTQESLEKAQENLFNNKMKQFLIFSVILATALSSPLAKKEQDTPAYTVVNTWEVDDTKVSIKSS